MSNIEGAHLFEFIREFARLSQKPVESLDSYIKTFWLDQIPHEPECGFVAWAETDTDEEEAITENWLVVNRPERLGPPPVVEELMPWVDDTQCQNSAIDVPELLSSILNPSWSEDNPEAEPQFLELEDHAQLQNAWDNYVETEWLPWAEEDRRKAKVQRCYDELFSMHRTQVSMGDQYEFLLAVGCLHWDTPSGGKKKRHMLVLPVTVKFDNENAVVTVQSAGSAPEIQLETDMLAVQERPPNDIEEDAEVRCRSLGDDLFHRNAKTLLKAYVQGLDSEGVFTDALDRVTGNPPRKPEITFAPALIVRRRTSRSLITACESIISQIQECENGSVPAGVRKLVGEQGVDESIFGKSAPERNTEDEVDHEVYFPLPSNDEQRRILGTLDRQVGVLVQGPPGTGKSQTIANLICHLLATGKRILVTSQKAPALRSLRKKLPPEVANLCMMVLGEGADEQDELRSSVGEVDNRRDHWDAHKSQRRVEKLRAELTTARETEAKAFERLCAVREQETFRHPLLFGGYEGTLSEISAKVRQDAESFAWFRDRLPGSINLIEQPPSAIPIERPDAKRLLYLLRQIKPNGEARARAHLLPLSDLPDTAQFRAMVRAEEKAKVVYDEFKQGLDHPAHDALSGLSADELPKLRDVLGDFYGRLRRTSNMGSDWEWQVTEKILRGNTAAFEALRATSSELLDHIQGEASQVADLEMTGLGHRSHRVMLQDAYELKAHFERGGGQGVWGFRPNVVKRCLYLLREVAVDGRACDSPDSLGRLIRWIQIQESTKKLSEQWGELTAVDTDHLPLNQAIGRYKELQFRLDAALALGKKAEVLDKQLDACDRGIPRSWYDLGAVSSLQELTAALVAQHELLVASKIISEAETVVKRVCIKSDSAPENHQIRNAIHSRLTDEYARCHGMLLRLWKYRQAYEERDQLRSKIAEALPEFLNALNGSFEDPAWDDRISLIEDAWNWVCADKWLSQMANPRLEDSLNQQVKQARHSASHALSQLAAEKAWQHSMRYMDENESAYQNLKAWSIADGNKGKGTGKYAVHDKQIARKCLEDCRDAVPAWVMPLYKVLETIHIRQGLFDVAIIDEASQSGPEALILAFLAKQIVVVGDDQQIRPEYVGIKKTPVFNLQARYLSNIPNFFLFGPPQSFFSAASVFFGNPIRLREHFRCMPEIIAFSNRLCYRNQPLIPLRQFGSDRLTPVLQTHYVSGGYQEGRKINPVEADAVVSAIERCCEDPAYAGKTFGVISLLHSSDQDRAIESLLIKRLDAEEIEQRNIVCGDAYDFQGDERDVIFLSMVSARSDNSRIGTMSDEKAKRRFNVAVSRARDQVLLFHSVQEGELGQNCLRRRLLAHMKQPVVDLIPPQPWTVEQLRQFARNTPRNRGDQPSPFDSWFEVDVFLAIEGQGHLAIPQYEVHGYYIDIVIVGGTRKLAVECDGDYWHGPEKYANDLHRQSQLERCGWEFFRVRGSHFYRDPDVALRPLWEMLETHDEMDDADATPLELSGALTEDEEGEVGACPQRPEQLSDQSGTTRNVNGDKQSTGMQPAEAEKQPRSSPRENRRPSTSTKHTPATSSLDQVLSMTPRELGKVICELLEECPNHSLKKDNLTTRVAKYLGIRTRGNPRKKLTRKIGWALTHLKKTGKVEEYRATNTRIRLLNPTGQGRLL